MFILSANGLQSLTYIKAVNNLFSFTGLYTYFWIVIYSLYRQIGDEAEREPKREAIVREEFRTIV